MSNDKDPVKAAVAAHWNRRAPTFDSDFGHSIATADERAAWDRIIGLIADGRDTGIDFAAWMLREAREKAAATGAAIRFEEGDAENLPFAMSSFDLVVSRHVPLDPAASGGSSSRVGPRAASRRPPRGDRQPVRSGRADHPEPKRARQCGVRGS